MSAEQMRCLVTGATGYIGGRLVPRLLESGFTVRALARNPDKLANVPWRNKAEVARGDLNDVASLEAAFTTSTSSTTWCTRWAWRRTSPPRSVA